MDPLLTKLWSCLIDYGYKTRINNKNGLERWNYVKQLFPEYKLTWKESSTKIYNNLLKLDVIEDETGLSHEEWERHHYLLQHGRIINNNPDGSLVRLMQIAYNIGQFRAEQEKKSYPVKQLAYYNENKLDKISSYINNISKLPLSVIDAINSNIDKKL